MTTPPLALVLRHEDAAHLGNLEPTLHEAGYETVTLDLHHGEFPGEFPDAFPGDFPGAGEASPLRKPDLLIILGASAGVYETATNAYIEPEIAYIRERLDNKLPTLGICFGSQLMAAALGATVSRGDTVQVGYRTVVPTVAGESSPIRHFSGVPVAQWHGDTFTLPDGVTRLAGSSDYANEAFGIGDWAMAVQFHPELTAEMHEDWLTMEPEYIARTGQTEAELRADRERHSEAMQVASKTFFAEWLRGLPS